MPILHGVAAAMYGKKDSHLFSVSTVRGSSKEGIELSSTSATEFDPRESGSTKAAFAKFLLVVDSLLREQAKTTTSRPLDVPVVLGFTREVLGVRQISDDLRAEYASLLQGPRSFVMGINDPPFSDKKNKNIMDVPTLAEITMSAFDPVRSGRSGGISLETRLFVDRSMGDGTEAPPLKGEDRKYCARLRVLYEKALAGDKEAHEELTSEAKALARMLGNHYREQFGRGHETRFFYTGSRIASAMRLAPNVLPSWLDLRDVFAGELARHLGIQHNFAVKTPADSPDPPFSNVVASIVADQFDALAGIRDPRAVLLKHVYCLPDLAGERKS